MIFESLKVENLMGCNYSIEFDHKYTVIIGDNRQGKTLTARLVMLALYGTGTREKELHDSWKLRPEELLPISDWGSVELILLKGSTRYKIYRTFGKRSRIEFYKEKDGAWGEPVCRKDAEVKTMLEEDLGITPGLMNVVMSNEQSLIGAISYDDKLQASVWEGWKWRTEIIRENIRRAREKCGREGATINGELKELEEKIDLNQKKWIEEGIFSKTDVKRGIDKEVLEAKLGSIIVAINNITSKITHYSEFHGALMRLDDLDDKITIGSVIKICDEKKKLKEFLDDKDEVEILKTKCDGYLATLTLVLNKGGKEGIQDSIRNLEDEEKKLKDAKELKEREKEPITAECEIFPPGDGEKLIVQIPDNIAKNFKYEQIASGGVAVPYDEDRLKSIEQGRIELQTLVRTFDDEKSEVKKKKDSLRDKIGDKKSKLEGNKETLNKHRIILEADKESYLKAINDKKEKEALFKKLDISKRWFAKLFEALSEEESMKKIKKETVAFINRIYEKIYEWDIDAKLLENDSKIIVTDAQGNVRSHPSGSEIHIMGLAWRWMVARGFDLPLVLDELDSLLDEKNFERTRRLIEEEMDRQTVILTLKESLKDLPGKIYKIVRKEGTSTVEEMR